MKGDSAVPRSGAGYDDMTTGEGVGGEGVEHEHAKEKKNPLRKIVDAVKNV